MGCKNCVKIEDLCEVKGGKRLPKGINLQFKKTDHPYIRVRDFGPKIMELTDSFEFVDNDTYKLVSKYIVQKGDLLLTIVGTIGLVGIVGDSLDAANLTENCVKLSGLDELDANYIYYFFLSNAGRSELKNKTVGAVQAKLPIKNIKQINIPFPSKEERKAIVAILSSLDDKIAINSRINDYLFECCMAKMNNVVGVSNCMMTVGDCCESIYSGGTPSTKNPAYWNGNLPWLSSGETRARFIIDTEKTITELGAAESSTKQAKAGDVVMASAGQGFTRGQTSMLFFDTYVNQSVVVMRPKRDYGAYLLLMLAAQYEELRAWSDSTSTRGSMSGKLLRQFELPYFGAEQAKELMDFATPIFAMIENNMRESKTITRTRDALLPKLMSGEIDVSKIKLSS